MLFIFLDSTHLVADSSTLPLFGALLSSTVSYLFGRGIQNSREVQTKTAMLRVLPQI